MPISVILSSMRTLAAAALLFALPAFSAPKPAPKSTAEQRAAQTILRSLNLHDRVAQLVIGVAYGDAPGSQTKEFQKFRHWVKDLHIGGFIINNRVQYGLVRTASPQTLAIFLNQMQRLSKVPLLVGGDFERGSSMRISDTTRFPFNMAYGAARDLEASRYEGLMTAREARAMGVQWLFAPVSDVNNNPDNPVINIRSYGENPEDVAQHVAAYIDGAHSDPKSPVLVTAKHFPGHGDTNVDSHLDLARLDASRERMSDVELKPFQAAIEHSVDSIMTAHMTVPAIEPDEIPATVSKRVLAGLLREELGFKGLVVTDAMDMAGLAKQFSMGEASVRAIQAGADVLLMPPDPEVAIRAVLAAVGNGRLLRKRIDESAQRVLEAKIRVGLNKKKLVDLDDISDALDSPEAARHAQEIADRAVTLVRNQGDLLPLATPNQVCVVISSGLRISSFGQRMAEEFRRRAPQARIVSVDNALPRVAMDAAVGDVAACSAVVFATFTTNPALSGELAPFVQKLTEGAVPVALVSFGNPYLLKDFPKAAVYVAAFSTATPSEVSVVKALFGEIPIAGKLPITIPNIAAYGEGIQLPAKTQAGPSVN
jgi:beta-N-acetylhexosaminidase